ncbi:MAG: EcsC family protein [Bryobacteraceae bacterium]
MDELSPQDLETIRRARNILENPGFAIRVANRLGTPVERLFARVPAAVSAPIQSAVRSALEAGMRTAANSVEPRRGPARNLMHKLGCGVSGALGGFFGMGALAVELPVSTVIMMRSIVDVARSQGFDPRSPETVVQCLQVFALRGGPHPAGETVYYGVRVMLSRALAEAAEFIAERGLASEGAPALVRFLTQVGGRFSTAVSEKAAAEAVPVIGAAGGAAINLIFIEDFQQVAWAHFSLLGLERKFGEGPVRSAYENR